MAKQKAKKNNTVVKLTAAQKLDALSSLVAQHHEKFDILADEIDKISNLMVALNKKVNAVLEAGDKGDITKDAVGNILLDGAITNLKQKVDELIELKAIIPSEDGVIGDNRNFVVARELDGEGNVVNPRTQFAVLSLPEALQEKFIGKKVGDSITSDDSPVVVEITELYKLASPEKEVVSEDTQEETKAEKAE